MPPLKYKRVLLAVLILGPLVMLAVVVGWYTWLEKIESAQSAVFPVTNEVIQARLGNSCQVADVCGNLTSIDCGYPSARYHYVRSDTGEVVCSLTSWPEREGWCTASRPVCQWREWLARWKSYARSACPPKQWDCPAPTL